MKHLLYSIVVVFALVAVSSCNSGKSQNQENAVKASTQVKSEVVMNERLNSALGSWLKEGVECYGIVIGKFADGSTIGKAVKCKVMDIKPDKIKMKTIESVKLLENEACDKMGLAYGDTWWEEEGDIFKTREEAEAYIKEKGWFRK